MSYEKKEEKIVEKIIAAVDKLDNELDEIDALSEDTKKHKMKKWFAEKKALHEIKKILHEEGRYAKYDEKELQKEFEEFDNYLNS